MDTVATLPQVGYASRPFAKIRFIPPLETFPAIVAFAQSIPGKLVLLSAFGLESFYFIRDWRQLAPLLAALAIVTFVPLSRHFVIAVAPLLFTTFENARRPDVLAIHFGVICISLVLFGCVHRWPDSLFGRRPVLFLLCGFSAIIILGSVLTPGTSSHQTIWNLIGIAESYLWFIGYSLMDRRAEGTEGVALQMATFHPVWGSASVPFPKGAAYLRRIEAQDPEQLAVVQLKGVKLLLWAILLSLFSEQWMTFFHVRLELPNIWNAVAMTSAGTPYPWHIRWASVLLCFFEAVLTISILGHRLIAFCRMVGFNALRNTCRPLAATSVAEFYNRFYYYYKELLVDFFFYPTFQRFWKGHRTLRLVFANFTAVFVGNAFFHYVHYWEFIREQGLFASLASFQVFFFYSFILATAISISQARNRRRRHKDFFRGQLLPSVCVGFIFCLLFVFGSADRSHTLIQHLRFVASLFFGPF